MLFRRKSEAESDFDWVSKQLKPLSAPYKSAWNGQPIDMRLNPAATAASAAASTASTSAPSNSITTESNRTGILPPGFINA